MISQPVPQAPVFSKLKKVGTKAREDLQRINNPKTSHGKAAMFAKGGFVKAADGIASKGKTKAKQIKM